MFKHPYTVLVYHEDDIHREYAPMEIATFKYAADAAYFWSSTWNSVVKDANGMLISPKDIYSLNGE